MIHTEATFELAIIESLVENGWNEGNALNFNKDLSFDKNAVLALVQTSQPKEWGYTEQQPPAILYHETVKKFLTSIIKDGLKKMQCHHVHLSADKTTATKVAERMGKPIILEIKSGEMFSAEH